MRLVLAVSLLLAFVSYSEALRCFSCSGASCSPNAGMQVLRTCNSKCYQTVGIYDKDKTHLRTIVRDCIPSNTDPTKFCDNIKKSGTSNTGTFVYTSTECSFCNSDLCNSGSKLSVVSALAMSSLVFVIRCVFGY